MSKPNSEVDLEDDKRKLSIYHPIKVYIVLVCSSAMLIAAIIIYIGFRGDLDKCDVDFKEWMLSFIIIGFILVTGAIIERCRNDDKHYYIMVWCSVLPVIVLWVFSILLLLNSVKTGVCKKVSPHVYNFVLSIVVISSVIPAIIIVILILIGICMGIDTYLIASVMFKNDL